jgi:alpha-L-fucosidase
MRKLIILIISISSLTACSEPQINIDQEWSEMHTSKTESIKKFNDAKFGMFIHFGAYSDLAGYWKGEKINGIGECIMRYAEIPRDEYRDVCKNFNPEKFKADEWVLAAKNAGMKYIVAMPKHADGFALYDSKITDYDIMDITRFGRDPMVELYQACQRHGINFSIYFNYLDWMDGGNGRVVEYEKLHPEEEKSYQYWANTWDPSPTPFDNYFEKKYKPQLKELLQKFPGIMILWHDMPMKITKEQSFSVYKMAYEIQPGILHNSRIGNYLGDVWIPGDNVIPDEKMEYWLNGVKVDASKIRNLAWETPGTMNNTWGYRSDDEDWKSTKELLYWLTSIVSKGGNYLLNIGPKGDGTIPAVSIERLKDIGQWMSINGESVYGTEKWIVNHEGPTKVLIKGTDERGKSGFDENFTPDDFWFTAKDRNIYVTSLNWDKKEVMITSLRKLAESGQKKIESVSMLGSKTKPEWKMEEKGLRVRLPSDRPNENGYVLKISYNE